MSTQVTLSPFLLAATFGDDPDLQELLNKYIKRHKKEAKKIRRVINYIDPNLAWVRNNFNDLLATEKHDKPRLFLEQVLGHIQALNDPQTSSLAVQGYKAWETKVQLARSIPITSFIKFNRAGFASCPWHNEKTGSLHLLKSQLKAYCHGGCGKSYDAIDYVQLVEKKTFKEAVNYLCSTQ